MKKKALITGITGQDGSYLAELLLEKGYEVHGLVRRSSSLNRQRIDPIRESLHLHYGDLGDSESLTGVMQRVRPDEVYNLAAQSHVGISFDMPTYTGEVTGLGTTRLLEAIRHTKPDTRFYQASSSELFGKVRETPQSENTPFYPRSPYAVAKLASYWATVNYREAHGLFACNGILFNHESPRRGENFVTRKITLAVAQILAGHRTCLALGNLDAKRDWGYAKDYVTAMWLMTTSQHCEDYVIGTGETHSVREFADLAFRWIEMPLTWEGQGPSEVGRDAAGVIRVKVDPAYYRPAEVDVLLADPRKAKANLGWEPKVTFETLVDLMMRYDVEATLASRPSAREATHHTRVPHATYGSSSARTESPARLG